MLDWRRISAASSAGRKPFSATQLTYGSFRISSCATRDAIGCNQGHSDLRSQCHSEALRGTREQSAHLLFSRRGAITYQGQSWVIRGAKRHSGQSGALSGTQVHSLAISSPSSPASKPSQCTRTHRTPLPPRVAAALSPRSRGGRDADRRRGRPRAESAVQIRKRSK